MPKSSILPCRPDNGRNVKVGDSYFGNQWVVPYNPLLSELLDCHVNAEVCTSIRLVKYIHKYVNKGGDRCLAELQHTGAAAIDAIKQYVDAR